MAAANRKVLLLSRDNLCEEDEEGEEAGSLAGRVCRSSQHCLGLATKNVNGKHVTPTPRYGAEMDTAPSANCHQTLVVVILDHLALNIQGKPRQASPRNHSELWKDIWLHATTLGEKKKKIAQTRHVNIYLVDILMPG